MVCRMQAYNILCTYLGARYVEAQREVLLAERRRGTAVPSARAHQPKSPLGISEGKDKEVQGGNEGPPGTCQEEGRGG